MTPEQEAICKRLAIAFSQECKEQGAVSVVSYVSDGVKVHTYTYLTAGVDLKNVVLTILKTVVDFMCGKTNPHVEKVSKEKGEN